MGRTIFETTYMLYAGKKVSYMFRATLVQELARKLYHKEEVIVRCLELMLQEEEIGFLKRAESRQGEEMIQINKSKHNEMKAKIDGIIEQFN